MAISEATRAAAHGGMLLVAAALGAQLGWTVLRSASQSRAVQWLCSQLQMQLAQSNKEAASDDTSDAQRAVEKLRRAAQEQHAALVDVDFDGDGDPSTLSCGPGHRICSNRASWEVPEKPSFERPSFGASSALLNPRSERPHLRRAALEALHRRLCLAEGVPPERGLPREAFVGFAQGELSTHLGHAELGRAFDKLDLDGDGHLSAAEFVSAYNQLAFMQVVVSNYIFDSKFEIPPGYDYSKSTNDNYQAPYGKFFGELVRHRKTRDYDYHVNYTKERQLWQDDVIRNIAQRTEPQSRPWIVFTCGAMGAGKGYSLSWMSRHDFFPLENIVRIDPDHFKHLMPEWPEYIARDSDHAGSLTHRESGYIQASTTNAVSLAAVTLTRGGGGVHACRSWRKSLRWNGASTSGLMAACAMASGSPRCLTAFGDDILSIPLLFSTSTPLRRLCVSALPSVPRALAAPSPSPCSRHHSKGPTALCAFSRPASILSHESITTAKSPFLKRLSTSIARALGSLCSGSSPTSMDLARFILSTFSHSMSSHVSCGRAQIAPSSLMRS
eukprot:m.5432 g.5432  ORF g.5432 m.5432 type:complete len:556 (+) comp2513_c0_seq1:125-1792(+)